MTKHMVFAVHNSPGFDGFPHRQEVKCFILCQDRKYRNHNKEFRLILAVKLTV